MLSTHFFPVMNMTRAHGGYRIAPIKMERRPGICLRYFMTPYILS